MTTPKYYRDPNQELLDLIKSGNKENVETFILSHNIDVGQVIDKQHKQTALFYACLIKDSKQCQEVVELLISKGCPVQFKDSLNQSALYYAVRENKHALIEDFISKGCDPANVDRYGQTALFYAARENNYECAEVLLEHKCPVDWVDKVGETALFYAAREGHVDMCKLLVEKGADVNRVDKRRQTPLTSAQDRNKHAVVAYLISKDAFVPSKLGPTSSHTVSTPVVIKTEPVTSSQSSVPVRSNNNRKKSRPATKKTQQPRKYQLCFVNDQGDTEGMTEEQLIQFEKDYPDLAQELLQLSLKNQSTTEETETKEVKQAPDPSLEFKQNWKKYARKIIGVLWRSPGAWVFQTPVDHVALGIPDYPQIVKRPMDFGTVKKNLNSDHYKGLEDFLFDVNQVFVNCTLYNRPESDVGKIGIEITGIWRKQCELHHYLEIVLDIHRKQLPKPPGDDKNTKVAVVKEEAQEIVTSTEPETTVSNGDQSLQSTIKEAIATVSESHPKETATPINPDLGKAEGSQGVTESKNVETADDHAGEEEIQEENGPVVEKMEQDTTPGDVTDETRTKIAVSEEKEEVENMKVDSTRNVEEEEAKEEIKEVKMEDQNTTPEDKENPTEESTVATVKEKGDVLMEN